ncbi:unnamed protein product [Arabis nemorensis]|uniref:C2H2-type domain-containing protein n=1 Tax=Arabis nemorensis TaxID=586526 RepID=A0A565AMQ7_9BRAS|nr:unnamed protein product [Arabis nemorensis]
MDDDDDYTLPSHKCFACYHMFDRHEQLVEHMKNSYHSRHGPTYGICLKYCKSFEFVREHLKGLDPRSHCFGQAQNQLLPKPSSCKLSSMLFRWPQSLVGKRMLHESLADGKIQPHSRTCFASATERTHKWSEPEQGNFDYRDADEMLRLCEKNDKETRGHCISSEVESAIQPWVQQLSDSELEAAAENQFSYSREHSNLVNADGEINEAGKRYLEIKREWLTLVDGVMEGWSLDVTMGATQWKLLLRRTQDDNITVAQAMKSRKKCSDDVEKAEGESSKLHVASNGVT